MIAQHVAGRIDTLFRQLVPREGPAPTVEGEMVRAICCLGHQFENNGDRFWDPFSQSRWAKEWLVKSSPVAELLKPLLKAGRPRKANREYAAMIETAAVLVADYVESRGGKYMPLVNA